MVSQDVRRTLVCRAFDKGFEASMRALIGIIDKLKFVGQIGNILGEEK